MSRQILGGRVNDGHGGIGAFALLQHHVRDGFAHDVGAPHHDDFGSIAVPMAAE